MRAAARGAVAARVVRGLQQPVSQQHGFDRGTPADRPYIEAFLAAHAADVRGTVMEVKEALYTTRYGGDRVTACDVVDVDATNAGATLVVDLDVPGSLPSGRYECIVLTQVLQYLDPAVALPQLYGALAPGGVLLLTIPAVCRVEAPQGDRWRLLPDGMRHLLADLLPPDAEAEVTGRGNLPASLAMLAGLAAEECGAPHEQPDDWRFPVVCLARVRRPA